jgi:hypothetical protein
MPELIMHVDAIARRRQRDVLYLEFHPQEQAAQRAYRYQDDEVRRRVLAWMDMRGFGWQRCGPYARPDVMQSYKGQVCLDILFDKKLPKYQELHHYLELPDGTMRILGVRFYLLTLSKAMENAEHDTPGFWERWADQF